ncbi:MAG TPA: phosphoribosyltransferase [Steroidobacteraceae bacterium]|nr:phosphoribosyltransferase [Steroidobacteraceae bacterium]
MIRRLAYASCYVYSPAGEGAICERSRLLRDLLKEGDAHFMLKYAVRVQQQAAQCPQLAGFFRDTDVLVPVPRSSTKACGTWVAADLARALVHEGLGTMAWPGLHRVRAVRKSSTAARGARPTVSCHFESFLMERPSIDPESVVLIDDVITKGQTLLAAAARVRDAFPHTQIRAFALLRTMGMTTGVEHLLDPCRGEIRWQRGDARRIP